MNLIATQQLNQRSVHHRSVGVTDLATRPEEKLDAQLRPFNEIHHLNNQRLAELAPELPQEISGFGAKPGSDCVGHGYGVVGGVIGVGGGIDQSVAEECVVVRQKEGRIVRSVIVVGGKKTWERVV